MLKHLVAVGVVVAAVVCLGFEPATCQAQGVGDYASGAAPKHSDWTIPPGPYGLIASYADDFLSNGPAHGNYMTTWAVLTDAIEDPDKADQLADFFILDVRGTPAFNLRHLPGAINIPYAAVAKPWNLDQLPTDQPILVVSGSGALSSQVATVLGMLGYNVRNLSGGMAVVPVS
jgi:rhodanese-related sulfurtransferase